MLIIDNWRLFADGVKTTLWLVGISLLCGGLLALPLSLFWAYRVPYLAKFAAGFSYLGRGTPLLVQVYIIYYGLAQFEVVRLSIFWAILKEPAYCALIAFSLNSAAYVSELLRGAIEATPRTEIEAAESIGMSPFMTIRRIVLPSAMRRSIPAYTNEIIFMLHASVIASTISIVDILGAGRTLNGRYYVAFEGFLTAAALYMIIVLILDRFFKKAERRYLAHLIR